MAFYDNKLWLLSHVHNSFISSDETSVCELVLAPGDFREELGVVAKNQGLPSFVSCIEDEEEDDDVDAYRRSPDIRGVSNWNQSSSPINKTGVKPATTKPEPEKAKTIVWKEGHPDKEETEMLFPKKILDPKVKKPQVSLLSHLLDNPSPNDVNPWLEFGKFDAVGLPESKAVRAIAIYFPMSTGEEAGKPIRVRCSRDSSVQDLLGLACYKYTVDKRDPPLVPPVENYSLFMCEEDGAVDIDFPALDPLDAVSKYGFDILAVGERCRQESSTLCITLHMPDGTFSQLEIQKKGITLGKLMEKGLERRKHLKSDKFNFGYHLEAADGPSEPLDPSTLLNVHGGTEFYIVRNNSKRASGPRDPQTAELCFLEAPLFQSFNVEIFTKVRTKVDIHLGISGDKVEIDPRQQSSSAKFWSKQKAVSHPLDMVVSCEIIERKQKGNRVIFRMVYLSDSGWGQRDFEAEADTAAEVVAKLNYLLDTKQSAARKQRKEYLQNKEKKRPRTTTK